MVKVKSSLLDWKDDALRSDPAGRGEPAPSIEEEADILKSWFPDPDFEAYAMKKLDASLRNPAPPLSSEDMRRHLKQRHAEARKKYSG